jgi:hypothetical protein
MDTIWLSFVQPSGGGFGTRPFHSDAYICIDPICMQHVSAEEALDTTCPKVEASRRLAQRKVYKPTGDIVPTGSLATGKEKDALI